MRRLPLLCLPLLLLALAAPAGASAAPLEIGISESQPSMFSHPLFAQLGIKRTRVVVSYNVLTRVGDDEKMRLTQYLHQAQLQGVEPLVTFEHARGAAEVCKKKANRRLPQCWLPSVADFELNFRLFRERFPWVTTFAPWNEANHFTQPTARNPKRAAQFTNSVAKLCPTCTIVAADILDQADNTKAKKPTFKATTRYVKAFRKALKVPRKICGIHNYSDTNRFRDTGTKAITKALGCKQIWLTETGGIAKFGQFKFDTKRQLKATKYMFKLARANKRIKRLYVYTFFGNTTPRFDAGLVDAKQGDALRPAFAEVKKQVQALTSQR